MRSLVVPAPRYNFVVGDGAPLLLRDSAARGILTVCGHHLLSQVLGSANSHTWRLCWKGNLAPTSRDWQAYWALAQHDAAAGWELGW